MKGMKKGGNVKKPSGGKTTYGSCKTTGKDPLKK